MQKPTFPAAGVRHILKNDELREIVDWAEFVAGMSAFFAPDDPQPAGLLWSYKAGLIRNAVGTMVAVAAGQIGLTGGATNYVEVNSSGVVSVNTSGFTLSNKPLRVITTDSGSVLTSLDRRIGFDFVIAGGAGGVLSGNYPNPGFSVDMATQAELNAVQATIPTNETIQDMLASFFVAGTGMSFTYDDASNTFTIVGQNPLTQEQVEDMVAAMVEAGSNVTATYDDATGKLTIAAAGDGAGLTQEQVEDIVAALLVSGTNVTLSYNDATGELTVSASGGGGGGTATRDVEQTGHGLSVGHHIKLTGNDTYAKAQGDSATNAEIAGRVTVVADADNFTFLPVSPIVTGSGYTAGEVRFLDPATAGGDTATKPDTPGQIVKPILLPLNATEAILLDYVGYVVPEEGGEGGGGGGSGDVVGPGSATDNALARFDSTSGKLIQDSPVTLSDIGAFTVPAIAAPSTPASGKVSFYAKSDGNIYLKNDSGTEKNLTSQSAVFVGAAISTGTAQNFSSGSQGAVTFTGNSPLLDSDGFWSSGQPTRLTVPTSCAGYYLCTGYVSFTANATGHRRLTIYTHSGTIRIAGHGVEMGNTENGYVASNGTAYLDEGDYVEMEAFQNSGGSLGTIGGSNHLSAKLSIIRVAS